METVQVDLLGNCFSTCLCDHFFDECSLRICSANEVGGQNNENSVYELYCRLNHSCCNNVVGQVVPHNEGGQAYQVGKHKDKDKVNEQDKVNDKDKINDKVLDKRGWPSISGGQTQRQRQSQ